MLKKFRNLSYNCSKALKGDYLQISQILETRLKQEIQVGKFKIKESTDQDEVRQFQICVESQNFNGMQKNEQVQLIAKIIQQDSKLVDLLGVIRIKIKTKISQSM